MSSVKPHPWAPGSLLQVDTSWIDNRKSIPLFRDDRDGNVIGTIPNESLVLYIDFQPIPATLQSAEDGVLVKWALVKVLSGETLGWVHQCCLASLKDESELDVL